MIRQIKLQDVNVDYQLKLSSRSRRMRVSVYSGGEVYVTAPQSATSLMIDRFLAQHAKWIFKNIQRFKKFPAVTLVPPANRKDYILHKDAALRLAKDRLQHFNKFYGFSYGKISIKNQKTLWGSCSKSGNLNFTYRIAMLPEKFSDYIIVHELCHRGEFNHSQKFWDLVAQTIPDYKELRKTLRSAN